MEELYRTTVEPVLLGQHTSAPSLLDVLRRIPKTDFHCHLNGSITPGLLAHMERLLLHERRRCSAGEHKAEEDEVKEGHMLFFNSQEKRMRNVLASPTAQEAASAPPGASASHSSPKDRMHYCFTVFDAIYRIMTNLAFTRLAVQDMVLCSAAENITVMEIRTSLRDGLQRTFLQHKRENKGSGRTHAEEDGEAAPVAKQMYVDVVIETVEHLLSGGLVDLESGELLPLADTAAILAHAHCTGEETGGNVAARWWRVYDRVYAPLFPAQVASPSSSSFPLPDAELVSRRQWCVSVLLPTLCHRMHVRLLLSINRGADVAAAWEAARLTTATQQRQIRLFHTWCCAEPREPYAAVMVKLRRTCWVTGMDLSGNCYKGDYTTFNAALAAARSGSAASATAIRTTAAVTIHGGEKQDAAELAAMVAFGPERWGHLVFTDDANLSVILAAQQGIELCLTSNLLTSGHADVAEHHLGHLLELWNTMAESGQANAAAVTASTGGCYGITEKARLASRLAFVTRRFGVEAASKVGADTTNTSSGSVADNKHSYVLPNLSFHTDDRGVFGTTLSDELLLASQHPGVAGMAAHLTGDATVSTAVGGARFFWHLERLSLLQIFELPLPVQLLATLLTHNNNDDEAKEEEEEAGMPRALLRERRAECVAALSADPASGVEWREWDTFVQLCARASAAATATGMTVPAALSAWEWAWLTDAFDHYYA